MTPEKEFITELRHYFNIRITEENEKKLTKMLEAYHDKKPPKLKLITIPKK